MDLRRTGRPVRRSLGVDRAADTPRDRRRRPSMASSPPETSASEPVPHARSRSSQSELALTLRRARSLPQVMRRQSYGSRGARSTSSPNRRPAIAAGSDQRSQPQPDARPEMHAAHRRRRRDRRSTSGVVLQGCRACATRSSGSEAPARKLNALRQRNSTYASASVINAIRQPAPRASVPIQTPPSPSSTSISRRKPTSTIHPQPPRTSNAPPPAEGSFPQNAGQAHRGSRSMAHWQAKGPSAETHPPCRD